MNVRAVLFDLDEALNVRLPGGGSAVRQIGAMVTTGAEALKTYTAQDVAELTGMSLSQARDTLSYYGIYLTTKSPDAGEDRVVSAQSLPAGTLVEHGTTLEVSLIHQEESMLGRY